MVLDISQDEIDQIWNDANELYDEFDFSKNEKERNLLIEKEYDYETSTDKIYKCSHTNVSLDIKSHENICDDCGLVVSQADAISQEWNVYKDETGNYSKNSQRGDIFVSDNPYDNQCSMFRHGEFANKNSLLFKLQQQLCFNHKQKNIWQVKKLYEHVAGIIGIKADIVSTANMLWCICVEANILTRAEVRVGLIAICFYYACIHNNIVMDRNNISKYFECRNLSKGEKVFCSIVENIPTFRNITQMKIDPNENNSFIFYCCKLKIEYKIAVECENLYNDIKNKLKSVTPKSAIAGIITYIIKEKYNIKFPSKKEIGEVISVCIPTLNKVISIIKNTIDTKVL
jgi:transcription initiation factor TFIIIB Brf1 subunit/transcription initiation factor TFIIB